MSQGCLCPGCAGGGSCWYKTTAWRRVSASVRTSGPCWVNGCPNPVKAADHVDPVHRLMTWAQFVARSNLRPSCLRHNTARGVAARLERETQQGVAPVERPHPLVARTSLFRRPA